MPTPTKKSAAGLLSAALIAGLLLAGGPYAGTAHACSCAETPSPEEALETSAAVFSGEVTDARGYSAVPGELETGMMPVLGPVSFDVREAWKGVSDGSVTVYGQGDEVSCGIDFQEGETYLVFAYHVDDSDVGPLGTDFCGATEQVDAETARQMLGPPPAALPETGGAVLDRASAPRPVAVAGTFASLALMGAAIFWWRRRHRRP